MAERSNKYFTAFCGGPSAAEYAPLAPIDARRGIIRLAGGIHRAATDGRIRPPAVAILPRKEIDCHGGKNLSSISGFLEDVRRVIRLQHLSLRTEEVYLHRIRESILFDARQYPHNAICTCVLSEGGRAVRSPREEYV